MVPIFPRNTPRPATRRHRQSPGPTLPPARLRSFCTCMIWRRAATKRSMINFIGSSGIFRPAQPDFRKASPWELSSSGQMYRGPGAPANGPRHHYTFELFALDTKVDVQPGTDTFETRTNVMKAIQGHILGKAVYMGLFRRPQ